MTAGLNQTVRIWRFSYPTDDEVGGSRPSGTVLYESVLARKVTHMPDSVFLEQGIETVKVSRFMLWPATLTIKEKDEIEITSPSNDLDYGKRFRIVGISDVGFHPSDKRGYVLVSTSRSEIAHANTNQ